MSTASVDTVDCRYVVPRTMNGVQERSGPSVCNSVFPSFSSLMALLFTFYCQASFG